ncbi:hypothetical protein ACW7BJ_33435 [Azospirillum argentinense]
MIDITTSRLTGRVFLDGGELHSVSTLPSTLAPAAQILVERLLCKDVRLFISTDWGDLEDANARHLNSWFPLLPHPASAATHWIGAVDGAGEVIATQGEVLLDCTDRSLGERLGDLTVFHESGTAPAEEWCFCASEAAFDTRGKVAWMTAGWVHPDWRGRGLFHPMGHLMRLLGWARWDVNWWSGVVEVDTVPIWNAAGAGRRRLEPRPAVLYQQLGVERCPLHFCRFSRAAVTLDAGGVIDRQRRAA